MIRLSHDYCRCMGYACDRKTECARFLDQSVGERIPWTERFCLMGREAQGFIASRGDGRAEEPTL